MLTHKLHAGDAFPKVHATLLSSGEQVLLSEPTQGADWKLVVVYRGVHCPLCTKYLNELARHTRELLAIGVDTIAVSADSRTQAQSHLERLDINFPLAYELSREQMESLGLYISLPRSEKETDHNFSEPGLFVINQEGNLQVVDVSNNPFVRPQLSELVSGLTWIRKPENNYPIRGTYR